MILLVKTKGKDMGQTPKSDKIHQLLSQMWQDYIAINPMAQKIHQLFTQKGEEVINDHIALRTFRHPRLGLEVISKPFLESGFEYKGDYHFPDKKLFAKHYQHPDENLPKIFISELKLEECSLELKKEISSLIEQIPKGQEHDFSFSSMGRPWKITKALYDKLNKESEYAAWVSAFGYRPNHFTVFVNRLKNFPTLESLNQFLKESGIKLNSSGGEIKGSPEVYLEQSSTLANLIEVSFQDGIHQIPACYYEFAKRYKLPSGSLYHGFVAASADKIFESTNRGQ
jgi:hypothetical protein